MLSSHTGHHNDSMISTRPTFRAICHLFLTQNCAVWYFARIDECNILVILRIPKVLPYHSGHHDGNMILNTPMFGISCNFFLIIHDRKSNEM